MMMLSTLKEKLLKSHKDDRFFYFSILFFCAFLPFQFALNPYSGIDLAIIRIFIPLLFVSYIVFALKNKLPVFTNNKTTKFLISFLILTVISIAFSHNITWSIRKLFFSFSIIPIYFLTISTVTTYLKKRYITLALVGGAAILAWIAIVQFIAQFIFGIDSVYTFLAKHIAPFFLGATFSKAVLAYPSWLVNSNGVTYMRATAMFPDPHMLSYYFGMLIPWAIALWATSTSHKKIFLITTISLVIADILTFTRGGYLALIFGALIILPLVSKNTAKKILLGASIIVILFAIAPHSPVAGRFASSFDIQEGSNLGRISNWQQAISIISKHPFGVGIGNYSLAVDPNASYREPIYAHNAYLDIAAELGIITVTIFVTILFLTFKSFWLLSKTQPFFIAGASSIAIFSFHSLVENPLYSVHILPLLLIIVALSVSSPLYEKTAKHR